MIIVSLIGSSYLLIQVSFPLSSAPVSIRVSPSARSRPQSTISVSMVTIYLLFYISGLLKTNQLIFLSILIVINVVFLCTFPSICHRQSYRKKTEWSRILDAGCKANVFRTKLAQMRMKTSNRNPHKRFKMRAMRRTTTKYQTLRTCERSGKEEKLQTDQRKF